MGALAKVEEPGVQVREQRRGGPLYSVGKYKPVIHFLFIFYKSLEEARVLMDCD